MAVIGGGLNRLTGRPKLPVFGGGVAAAIPTYAEFVTAETARTGGSTRAWSDPIGLTGTSFRTTCATATGLMSGSPWQTSGYGTTARWAQHCFPSEAVFSTQVGAGRLVTATIVAAGIQNLVAVSRNGFTSSSGADEDSMQCTDFRYYDDTLGPVKMNPFAGTGPTPYTLGT